MDVEGAGPSSAEEPAGDGPARVLRLDLTFDGTAFQGWQRQPRGRSVQAEVEAALEQVLGAPHVVVGCGRTDAGVHARRLVASTRTASALPAGRLARALDALLPRDVGVLSVRDAEPAFHAIRDARWKWYRYAVLVAAGRRPLVEGRAWRRVHVPDLAALERAATALVGRHDFASFSNSGSPRVNTVRTLFTARWTRRGRGLWFDVVGDGFLYRMVRTLVGTQWAAAEEADPAAAVQRVLAAKDRRCAGAAAPAHGLTLMDVGYDGDPSPCPGGPSPRAVSRGTPSRALPSGPAGPVESGH